MRSRRPGPDRGSNAERFGLHPPEGEAPRLSQMPVPKKTKGMIAGVMGQVFQWPFRIALAGLYRAGFLPWQLTVLSVVANGFVGWLIVSGRFFLPGVLLVVSGLLDVFDGSLARLRGEESRAGAFLDSVSD